VDVGGGGGVFVAGSVGVGNAVGGGGVSDGSSTTVGVSVTATFDGRLQACIARKRTSVEIKIRDFIISPFYLNSS
jgi:hypothetical protein